MISSRKLRRQFTGPGCISAIRDKKISKPFLGEIQVLYRVGVFEDPEDMEDQKIAEKHYV